MLRFVILYKIKKKNIAFCPISSKAGSLWERQGLDSSAAGFYDYSRKTGSGRPAMRFLPGPK